MKIDQVGAHQRAGRRAGGKPMRVGEVAARYARFHHGDIGLLGHGLQRVPGAAVEDARAGDDHRPLGLANHLGQRADPLRIGIRTGVGAVLRLLVEVAQFARIFEARAIDFGGKIEVHGPRHAGLQLAERIRGVFVDAVGIDQALAELAHAFGGRLLIGGLDPHLAYRLPTSACCWPAPAAACGRRWPRRYS